jgi:hypothetical protein
MSRLQRHDTPAQTYAALAGLFLLVLGVLALIFTSVEFETAGAAADGPEFLVWSVNGWTAVLWIVLGSLGLLTVLRLPSARAFALGAGLLFALVALWGSLDGESVAGVLPATTANNATYAVLAVLGLLFGLLPLDDQRAPGQVERERRFDRATPTDRIPTGRR